MKKLFLSTILAFFAAYYSGTAQKKAIVKEVKVTIDLNQVQNDKVMVTIIPPTFKSKTILFNIPKTIPGTYSYDNYGKLLEDFKVFDKKGKEMVTSKKDQNSWEIPNANLMSKITYWVNDTYDSESGSGFGKEDIFSPAGTNILAGKNFIINNHAFVGYFEDKIQLTEMPYVLTILHPANLTGTTSLLDSDKRETVAVFHANRYFDLTDNPIMFSKPDFEKFMIDGMEILFSVYSPSATHTALSLLPGLKKTMNAQKAFLGSINSNKRYTILLYLSNMSANDAKGFGALEHHTSTTVVFPEFMTTEALGEQLKDLVSHEFFHTLTPLSVHSEEIRYFNYKNPKMSKHLWMYEGVTEYFANLFQVNQSLIKTEEFYERMTDKITNAETLNDTMSFTLMSTNVLMQPYKSQYLNVYEKGALIGMCIDIIIREQSNGERGILDLMKKLSVKYGINKPFKDSELFAEITQLTYPEVGRFLSTYVEGTTPIPYDVYFAKMGVSKSKIKVPVNPFLKDRATPYITVNPTTKEISVIPSTEMNDFMSNLGLKGGDIIVAVNDKPYNLDTIYDLIMESQNWIEGDDITLKIKRDGKEQIIKGKVKLNFEEAEQLKLTDPIKEKLNTAWLKG